MFLSKAKNGFYYLYYQCEISQKRKKISCKTKRKTDANIYLSNFVRESRQVKREKPLNAYHLLDLRKEVLQYVSDNLRRGTLLLYKNAFKDLLRITGNKAIKLITVSDIEKFKSIRLTEVKPSTVNIQLTTIKAIFNIALRFNWIHSNPCDSIKKIAIPQKDRLIFSDSEIKLILNNTQKPVIKNLIKFALLTGCRLSEICNVQWKDINFQDLILNVSNKDNFNTKSGKQRQIPISDELLKLLNEMLGQSRDHNILSLYDPERYIFSIRYGKRLLIEYVSKEFKKILRRCKLPERFHFHCTRHTFITNLIKSGVNINYVKEIAGHSDIKTSMNYIHLVTNDLREAVNCIKIV
ncbi:MAG TPA: tyrosine-type recombinase/integrase [Ignavibacteria bacterium]|nr:tyrosine-type recombinase/integrase [Ignavibacteria bacterium]HMR41554.1 tyrosine-type recombinase/integrase [Ignavibacteria bacterium]